MTEHYKRDWVSSITIVLKCGPNTFSFNHRLVTGVFDKRNCDHLLRKFLFVRLKFRTEEKKINTPILIQYGQVFPTTLLMYFTRNISRIVSRR